MTGWVRIAKQALVFGFAELRETYTWRTWIFGWLLRLLLQVAFYALVGGFMGNRQTLRFVLVGNIVVLVCLEAMIGVLSIVGERMAGTLPLLTIAPSSHVPVYLGRGVQWLVTGVASSTVAWFAVPPLLGERLPWPAMLLALPLIVLIGLSSYCYSCCLSGIALRRSGVEWIILNLGYLWIMAFCGVNVPVDYWPSWLRMLSDIAPVSHGLRAVRLLLDGASADQILSQAALEAAVGVGWLLVAVASFDRIVGRGRVDGSLEFTS